MFLTSTRLQTLALLSTLTLVASTVPRALSRVEWDLDEVNIPWVPIFPVDKFGADHPMVTRTVCDVPYDANANIPSLGKWSWKTTAVADNRPCNKDRPAGELFYAYNNPDSFSSNTGYDHPKALTLLMIIDTDGGQNLVLLVDSPGEPIPAGQDSKSLTMDMVAVGVSTDFGVIFSDDSPPATPAGSLDEVQWDASTSTVTMDWNWMVQSTDGAVLGPIPEEYTFDFFVKYAIGIEEIKIGSWDTNTNTMAYSVLEIPVANVSATTPFKFRMSGKAMTQFCEGQSSCGGCSVQDYCNFGGSSCSILAAIEDKVAQCECQECTDITSELECATKDGCGWCTSGSGSCVTGIEKQICASTPCDAPVVWNGPPSGGRGDPHLRLAEGGHADLRGEDGAVYNMLSASNMSLNALFEHSVFFLWTVKVHGSFITDAFWVARTRQTGRVIRVEFTPNWLPMMMVHENGNPREMKLNEELTFEDVVVKFSPRKNGHVASVRSADWIIEAFARDIRWSAITGKKQIDFTISPLRNPLSPAPNGNIIAPHGVIGQSYDGDGIAVDGSRDNIGDLAREYLKHGLATPGALSSGDLSNRYRKEVTTAAMAEGAIEGVAKDYQVPNFFSTDFKYSRFDAVVAEPRDISKLTGAKRHVANAPSSTGSAADDMVPPSPPTQSDVQVV